MTTDEWNEIERAKLESEITTLRSQLEEARKRECTDVERDYMGQILSENADLKKERDEWKTKFSILHNKILDGAEQEYLSRKDLNED